MDRAISEYQKWKEQGEGLRAQAKEAMENRFRDLLTEAVRIAQEYQSDFGHALKPPSLVTGFRYKAAVKGPARPVRKAAKPETDPKLTELQKRVAQAQKKLEAAKAAGKPTQNLEDRVYELEDALRLRTSV